MTSKNTIKFTDKVSGNSKKIPEIWIDINLKIKTRKYAEEIYGATSH